MRNGMYITKEDFDLNKMIQVDTYEIDEGVTFKKFVDSFNGAYVYGEVQAKIFKNINFSVMKNIKDIIFRNVIFDNCSFIDLNLEYIEFRNCTFYSTIFSDSVFTTCRFTQNYFDNSTITDCIFEDNTALYKNDFYNKSYVAKII
jgi:uncharacterized protein YjbI with pentapeptide repeats